jgi:hypothetical protein
MLLRRSTDDVQRVAENNLIRHERDIDFADGVDHARSDSLLLVEAERLSRSDCTDRVGNKNF